MNETNARSLAHPTQMISVSRLAAFRSGQLLGLYLLVLALVILLLSLSSLYLVLSVVHGALERGGRKGCWRPLLHWTEEETREQFLTGSLFLSLWTSSSQGGPDPARQFVQAGEELKKKKDVQ